MLVLGISGSPFMADDPIFLPSTWWHDSAAVLVEDGVILAAIEEERLSRFKHTNRFPERAIKACLEQAGVHFSDLDHIVFNGDREHVQGGIARIFMSSSCFDSTDPNHLLDRNFKRLFGQEAGDRLGFVNHHLAHALSTYYLSGWEDCLTVTLDGRGDQESGLVISQRAGKWELLETLSIGNSLGLFYEKMIDFIGYATFEEYKVMSLAACGDPSRFRERFASLYHLHPEGRFEIVQQWDDVNITSWFHPRRRGEKLVQKDRDFAAALQESLEIILNHMLGFYRAHTDHRYIALAGGVSLNCAAFGKILTSNLFENIFVQPASNDAGCAIGAALYPGHQQGIATVQDSLQHCYWGPALPNGEALERSLARWEPALISREMEDPSEETAKLLMDGAVIGWAQGGMEFGPRALGNRSILADPRKLDNKTRINDIIKQREFFQPFAPSIIEEELHTFFEVPSHVRALPFMVLTVKVKPEFRDQLAAVIHVDGTARVQTVSRVHNPAYWSLIHAFGQRSGIPILLNTSFNNRAEPIVCSEQDALITFASAGLDYVVIENFLVQKADHAKQHLWAFNLTVPPHFQLTKKRFTDLDGQQKTTYEITSSLAWVHSSHVSVEMFEVLERANGQSIADTTGVSTPEACHYSEELFALWNKRFLVLSPPSSLP